ncbi:MAG: hypothetical protein PHX83_13815 [Acidobacteriia bacterium]|nr:hypothetical protein [Terriglobia bacterium]
MSNGSKTTWQLIFVPAVITLIVTIVRLIGELNQWSSKLFNREAGGPMAIIGIVWLIPIFGIYFALKLAGQGQGPASKGKAIGLEILGLIVAFGAVMLSFSPKLQFAGKEYVGYLIMIICWFIFMAAWSDLGKTLLAYGYAARIPVLIVMLIAMIRNWTTHYNAFPPEEFPLTSTFGFKFWHGAVLPQMIFWITFTMAVGGLFGIITALFTKKPAGTTQTA